MRLEALINQAAKKLQQAGVGSARLDTLILLEDELKKDRAHLLAHPELELSAAQIKKINKQIKRRAAQEPLAYIRGFSEFYGRRFRVNKHVLEPRPESETMVELLLNLVKSNRQKVKSWQIADVGTGSGALGITAALELHNSSVDLYDIDASALAVAKHNCELHELHLKTIKRDLLRNSHKAYDVILANLPYIPNHWQLHESVKAEPRLAIFGGKDGLDVYRRLFEQLTHFNWRPKYILTESLPPQHEELIKIAKSAGFKLLKKQDLTQVFQIT